MAARRIVLVALLLIAVPAAGFPPSAQASHSDDASCRANGAVVVELPGQPSVDAVCTAEVVCHPQPGKTGCAFFPKFSASGEGLVGVSYDVAGWSGGCRPALDGCSSGQLEPGFVMDPGVHTLTCRVHGNAALVSGQCELFFAWHEPLEF